MRCLLQKIVLLRDHLITRCAGASRTLPQASDVLAHAMRGRGQEALVSANKARGMLAYRYPVGGDVPDAPLYGVLVSLFVRDPKRRFRRLILALLGFRLHSG